MATNRHPWYVWLGAIRAEFRPAKGTFPTIEAAFAAYGRFQTKFGSEAGSHSAAGSLRLVEFPTREAAREGDVSDYSSHGGKTVPRTQF